MGLLTPTVALKNVTDITPELLKSMGCDAIRTPTDQTPYEGVQDWINLIKQSGFAVVICSNNFNARITPFSQSVGLDCVAMSLKPFPFGFNRAKKKLHEKPKAVVVVGDQIYTDVLGANLARMQSILLEPRSDEKGFSIWLRRKMEIRIRKKLYQK